MIINFEISIECKYIVNIDLIDKNINIKYTPRPTDSDMLYIIDYLIEEFNEIGDLGEYNDMYYNNIELFTLAIDNLRNRLKLLKVLIKYIFI